MSIKIDDLATEIVSSLEDYNADVTEKVKEAVSEAGKTALNIVKSASPRKTGKYKKGWRLKVVYDGTNDRRIVIHNSTDYQLTHLLEHGHVGRDGSRVEGKSHIYEAQKEAEAEFEKLVEEALQK